MKGALLSTAAALALCAAICAAESFSPNRLKARSYADLGPETIDVSGYPAAMREKYAVFTKTCALCHSLARSINAAFAAQTAALKAEFKQVQAERLRRQIKADDKNIQNSAPDTGSEPR